MGFILRILFSGLIVFVPSQDGQQVTVLLLNVPHTYHSSDGTSLADHKPLLLARGGSCTGDCPTRDEEIAQYLFSDKSTAAALDSLEAAVSGGWVLDGSEIAINKGSANDPDLPSLVLRNNARASANGQLLSIPTTSSEREDFSWVADLAQICPSGCPLDQAIHSAQPPAIVAARFRLRTGKLYTYSVARIGSNVTPVHFQRLDGTGSASPYTQAVASWVGADIAVQGDSIELVESKFADGTERTMTLTPDENGRVEIAMINLPPFVPPASSANEAPEVGKHFEMFYELSETPPAAASRLVPRAGAAPGAPSYPEVDWHAVHPQTAVWSELLNKIRLDIGRSAYDRVICPPAQNVP
ncbi:MAG TPA: hypothetical protein VN181_09250 [Thermoanaerobaculia bacterium]|nr:hypothetical protein [Thermoanaerobaculia bacterium]